MSKLFEEMAQGTAEALAYMEGAREGFKVTAPASIDVRAIRVKLHLSQGAFAERFGLSVDAIRNWETGRRIPEAPARVLLAVIAHAPEVVRTALRSIPSSEAPSEPRGPVVRPGRPKVRPDSPATARSRKRA